MIRRSIPVLFALLVLSACSSQEAAPPAAEPTANPAAVQGQPATTASGDGTASLTAASVEPLQPPSEDAAVAPAGSADSPVVELYTNKGLIAIQLDPAKAPTSVKNFLAYVNSGFYDGTIFHRVKPDFMVQGGGMTPDMTEKPTSAPIKNEGGNGLHNVRGSIAMARTDDPNSATSQFYINVKDNGFLDASGSNPVGYAVFGKVIAGMDVVDAIAVVPTSTRGFNEDVPNEPILIEKAKVKS